LGEKDPHVLVEWYDKLSTGYDQLYNKEQAVKHQRVSQILAGRKFRLLVDVGCGTGAFLETIAPVCEHLLGFDFSSNMIKIAKARNQAGKIDFLVAASPYLPLRNGVADCVVSISLVDQTPEIHATEFGRITTQDGTIVFTVFDPKSYTRENQMNDRIGKRERLRVINKTSKSIRSGRRSRRDFKNKNHPH
jgi:ubiquinone/menaquinone biosynthesis C-methylase UbiE